MRPVLENPTVYNIESKTITLLAPEKEGDIFIGWTGSNGDEPQLTVTIPKGSTGERYYIANYLQSGHEMMSIEGKIAEEQPFKEKIWVFDGDLYIHTSTPGSSVRIFTPDGILHKSLVNIPAGETQIPLPQGIYIVTLNNGIGYKIVNKR